MKCSVLDRTGKRGFTLVELLVALAVIAALAAIVGAAVPAALRGAKAARAVSHMRQIHVAISLYRAAWDGVPGAATPQAAGLPVASESSAIPWNLVFGTEEDLWVGCGSHPSVNPGQAIPSVVSINYFFGVTNADYYPRFFQRFGERLPAVFDMRCTPPDRHVNNPYESRLGLAVLLQGNAVRRWNIGDPFHPSFWTNEEIEEP